MKFKDQFQFVRQNMKKNKVRVFMTMLATAIGCAFLIVLASVGFGLHDSLIQDTMQNRAVTEIQVHGKETDGSYQALKDEDIDYFESISGVRAVTRKKQLQQSPVFSINDYQVQTMAMTTDFPSEMKAGLELSKGKLPEKDNEIVVGHDFASRLAKSNISDEELYNDQDQVKEKYQYDGDLIGKEIEMKVVQIEDNEEKSHTIPLTISGITEAPNREWFQDQNVYISESVLKEVEQFTGTNRGMITTPGQEDMSSGQQQEDSYDQVTIYAENMEVVQEISDELKNKNYASYSVVSEIQQINMIFTIIKTGLIIVGTIAVLIASIGIYNTMTMAVTERAPDIGIMKAIGAKPKTIKRIFLLESGMIGLAGAIIGTAIAFIVSMAVNIALPLILESVFKEELPPELRFSMIPWSLVLIAAGICLLVTVLSGLRPARRATQIDVLKAMRREV
ncbi:ABC transporter permease [Sediminibacillus halophilus]|uniref:Acetoin utilization transport system permease protein n=1 Tax=Sediminibacillus halophilus TaxID=482461 RepID=A0A1G9WTW9_9BACI|nr:ABC transporter permease [Sediminibacillus halophilus]SDM87837.1 acetoin utilization transport system permease protein [Sediminibacillus halophilus]